MDDAVTVDIARLAMLVVAVLCWYRIDQGPFCLFGKDTTMSLCVMERRNSVAVSLLCTVATRLA